MNGTYRCDDNIQAWCAFADDYIRRAVVSTRDIHYGLCIAGESELRLLPALQNKRVLDVGSGGGENSLVLESLGALVVGIEPVERLHEHALRARRPGSTTLFLNCEWGRQSVEDYAPFDLVLFVGSSEFLALDAWYFDVLNRLTVTGSSVFISRMHPFWTSLYGHETATEDRRNYFRHGRVDRVRYGKAEFSRFHYGIGELTGRFAAHGWLLSRIAEPEIVPPDRAPFYIPGCYEDEVLIQRMRVLPMTVVLTFVRQ